jgi:hypothetical protein
MATLASTRESDIEIFKYLFPKAYPKKQHLHKEMLAFVNDGVIAIETLLERALAIQGGLTRNSTAGEDFTDGSDAKKAAAYVVEGIERRERKDGSFREYAYKRYLAQVRHIVTKRGALRILVFEPLNRKFHFFKIPNKAFSDVQTVKIEFNFDGTIKPTCRWLPYKVGSFKELASAKQPKMMPKLQ